MISPINSRPIVTKEDIQRGSIVRYFVKFISRPQIFEVNLQQYKIFEKDPYYISIKMPWIVAGNLFPVNMGNKEILSVEQQNKKIVEMHDKQLPGLRRIIRNYLEFATPTINKP